jgi:hypothetical protein
MLSVYEVLTGIQDLEARRAHGTRLITYFPMPYYDCFPCLCFCSESVSVMLQSYYDCVLASHETPKLETQFYKTKQLEVHSPSVK